MTSSAEPKWIREVIKRVVAFLPREDWIVIGWVVAIKTLLVVIGVKSYPMLWDKYAPTPNRWFALWDQWDFGYYQKIAEFGYEAKDGSLAFYPLFPWLLRLVAYISGSYLAAGLIVSGIASVATAVLLRRLVQLDYDSGVALRSVWFFLIFPTGYFCMWDIAKACSWLSLWLYPGCARRSLATSRFATSLLLADTRNWRCSCSHAGRRGSTKIFHESPVESAVVVDRISD